MLVSESLFDDSSEDGSSSIVMGRSLDTGLEVG